MRLSCFKNLSSDHQTLVAGSMKPPPISRLENISRRKYDGELCNSLRLVHRHDACFILYWHLVVVMADLGDHALPEAPPVEATPAEGAPTEIPIDAHSSSTLSTPPPPSPPSEPAQKARDLTSAALDFLSNASNETLGACAVGLCATTYLVLGRVGLVLIGVAGGVALHATWEGGDGSNGSVQDADRKRRKEAGAEIARRVLELRGPRSQIEQTEDMQDSSPDSKASTEPDFEDFKPATRAALTSLTDAVIRDYVKYAVIKPLIFSS